jgi:hypothetical protein
VAEVTDVRAEQGLESALFTQHLEMTAQARGKVTVGQEHDDPAEIGQRLAVLFDNGVGGTRQWIVPVGYEGYGGHDSGVRYQITDIRV